MKLRMLTLAVTAIALSAQGVAQQSNDGLERALADLNSGLVATQGAGVNISGDARVRNNWTEDAGRKDIDYRFRLNFTANINESVSAFIGTVSSNDFGSGVAGSNGAAGAGNVEQAYINMNSLFGSGGSWTFGQKHTTVASGRVIGHDDWNNTDAGVEGIWYSHDAGGSNLSLGLHEGQGGDNDVLTVELDWGLNIPGMGDVTIAPYHIAERTQGGLPGQNDEAGTTTGAEISGEFLGFGFDAELAKQGDFDASAFGVSLNIDALGAIPGVSSGAVDFTSTSADDGFSANGVTWMSTGINSSQAGGAWNATSGDRDSSTFGVSFSPAEGWSGRLARVSADDANEWDITMNHTFGGGVAGWFGYAATDDDGGNTLWMSLGVDF
jgi:hypothetical protein